jgi:hypothetical protein
MVRWLTVLAVVAALVAVLRSGRAAPGARPDDKPLKLPPGWKADDPLPLEKTNCVRCHLTAGRELTAAVQAFARSVHDRYRLSCNDCHGGNTEDDTTAHEDKHGFIGTKLSAHMAECAACHSREAESFRRSKHYWDLSKRINRDYPVCVDCHGNHDIGRPPAEFALTNVCTDCHKQFARDMPTTAAVVAENDRLWQVLRKVHARNKKAEDPTPEPFREDLDRVRTATARLMHRGRPVTAEEARAVNAQAQRLHDRLEAWLKEQK